MVSWAAQRGYCNIGRSYGESVSPESIRIEIRPARSRPDTSGNPGKRVRATEVGCYCRVEGVRSSIGGRGDGNCWRRLVDLYRCHIARASVASEINAQACNREF